MNRLRAEGASSDGTGVCGAVEVRVCFQEVFELDVEAGSDHLECARSFGGDRLQGAPENPLASLAGCGRREGRFKRPTRRVDERGPFEE